MVRGENFDIWQWETNGRCRNAGGQIEKLPRNIWPRYHRIGARSRFIIPKSGRGNSACACGKIAKTLDSPERGKESRKRRKKKEICCHSQGCEYRICTSSLRRVGFVEKDDIYLPHTNPSRESRRGSLESILLSSSSRLSILEYYGERGWNDTVSRSFSGWKVRATLPNSRFSFSALFSRSPSPFALEKVALGHTYRSRGKREEEGSIEWRVARSMILRISVLPETKLYVQGQWIATDRENGGNVIINQTRVQNEKKFGK